MSYLQRVEKQKALNRATEERRKEARVTASVKAEVYECDYAGQIESLGYIPEPIPKATPAERARCGRGLAWRCGMPRGHCSNCIRREQVTRQMFDEELVRMAEKRALDEAVKAKGLTPPSGSEGK